MGRSSARGTASRRHDSFSRPSSGRGIPGRRTECYGGDRGGDLYSVLAAILLLAASPASAKTEAESQHQGRAVYDFYCYQCHGYAGDARTLTSRFVDPPPRDFTQADPEILDRERMIDAVTRGRPGTAMASFSSVLDARGIAAVVDYVRAEYMSSAPSRRRYHTAENGWPDHERYGDAFPFATGEIATDTPWERLTDEQRRGWRLFMKACTTCHDGGSVTDEGPIWELRALSYPRHHYSHRSGPDAVSGASPYALHDRPPVLGPLGDAERRGERLFQDNCAFCHAADATARNWIGSFLEPRPRDLTDPALLARPAKELTATILAGVPGSSMPAWRGLLSEDDVADILAYLGRVSRSGASGDGMAGAELDRRRTTSPTWQRAPVSQPIAPSRNDPE